MISLPLETVNIKEILLTLSLKLKIMLYNIINKLQNENNNLKLQQQKFENEIKELKICPNPIGAIYTQYPNCKEPKELWNNTIWELLNFNNVFFRGTG